MGKTYLETIKYMIVADFSVNGLVERPDVIGAIFGQSEGLLGSQLDIKELQQNGKIGRIEITVQHQNNTTTGTLKLPCSLTMVETAIIAASIESIDKVGPCDTKFSIKNIEDTRGIKRKQIKNRAIDLLGKIIQEEIPDTRELMSEITNTLKTKEITTVGSDKLPAGPTFNSSSSVIVVEGRADVINLLRYGFTNTISTGGARIPKSLANLLKDKEVTLFLDGDRGGEIQKNQLLKAVRVDYIAKAPDGKEVEELTQKEINQALRRKINANYVSSTKPKSPVRATKFSVVNDKITPNKLQQKIGGFDKSKSSYKNNHSRSNLDNHRSNYNSVFRNEKDDTEFSSMLSNIPNAERVDVVRDNFRNRSNNRDRNNNKERNNNRDRNNKSRDSFNKGSNKDSYQKPSSSEKPIASEKPIVSQEPKENVDKPKINPKGILPVLNDKSKQVIKEKNIPKVVEKPKETPKPKKPKVLPKLNDKMKNNFLKILEDIDGKGVSRILNEKLRRIGSAKNNDLSRKVDGFKENKIFAIVTDIDVNQELVKKSISKGVSFIVTPKAKIKNKAINIITYNELKK